MRHKLVRILSQLLPRMPCCLDKVKPSGVSSIVVTGFNPFASSKFFCVLSQKYCQSSVPVFMKSKNFVL